MSRRCVGIWVAAACCGWSAALGADLPGPSGASPVLQLEVVDDAEMARPLPPLPSTPHGKSTGGGLYRGHALASQQGPDFRSLGGNSALGQLRNPFEGGRPPQHSGLFGRKPRSMPSPQMPPPPMPMPMPAPMPPPPMMPGAVPPGFAPPGAVTPGYPAPGAVPPGAAPPGYSTPAAPGVGAEPGAFPGPGTMPPIPGTSPMEGAPPLGGAPEAPGAAPAPSPFADAAAPGLGAGVDSAGPGFGGGLGAVSEMFPMVGDMTPALFRPIASRQTTVPGGLPTAPPLPDPSPGPIPPNPPGPRAGQPLNAAVRYFKMTENMSPRPQDRVFVNMNTYWNLNETVNRLFDAPIRNVTAYRYFFGLEKTFNQGKGSLGLRLPIDTLTADSTIQGFDTPTSTSVGNLSIFGKYILEQNPRTGSLISTGLAITTPTGPGRFAGAPYVFGINSTYIQPFVGYIWNFGRFYLHGFSAFEFPVNPREVTMMFNDVGIGYYLMRSQDPTRFLTAVAPTFEVHVNSPLNHRAWYNAFDIAGTADVVNLTYGLNFEFRRRAILTTALVTPVSSPKPFDAELAVMLNIFFGRTRRDRINITPPPLL